MAFTVDSRNNREKANVKFKMKRFADSKEQIVKLRANRVGNDSMQKKDSESVRVFLYRKLSYSTFVFKLGCGISF